jgi:hypothetical protein
MQIVAEICENKIAGKDQFFRKFSIAQIEKCKTNKSYIITWGMCTKNRRSIRHSGIFHEFLQRGAEICFWIATSPNLTFFLLEDILGTKTKEKG